jgi:hypothetical protein
VGPSAKRRKVETPPKKIKIPDRKYITLASYLFPVMRENGCTHIDKTGDIADLLLLSTIGEMMAAGPLPLACPLGWDTGHTTLAASSAA